MTKAKIQFWIDLLLLCVFVLVIATAHTGGHLHEVSGFAMIAIVVGHLAVHRKWIVAGVRRYLMGTSSSTGLN